MTVKNPKQLVNVPNETILNLIRNNASMDYQRRIPAATKANVQDQLAHLMNYRPMWNEFVHALVNQIGLVIVQGMNWTNPLGFLKRGMLEFGDTIEEIYVGLLKAKVYDPDREYLEQEIFAREIPRIESNFHKINRKNYYKVSVNEDLLKQAFQNPTGLSSFVNELMNAPATSDEWDEFLVTCQLFAEYEKNGGFFKVNVPDVANLDSGSPEARKALRIIRSLAGEMAFPSETYNAAGMPSFAKNDELMLFTTPAFNAALDVEALAAAFNMEKAEVQQRIVLIPEKQFKIEGCQAILTTEDFFVIADSLYETRSQENPVGLHTNYFLHHWQVVSASRFAPAVMLTTGPGTDDSYVTPDVTSVSDIVVKDRKDATVTELKRGELYDAFAAAVTDPVNGPNDAVRWSLAGGESEHTYITQEGVIHIGADDSAASVTVTATAVWIDPDDTQKAELSKTATLTLTGEVQRIWPVPAPEPAVPDPGEGDSGE